MEKCLKTSRLRAYLSTSTNPELLGPLITISSDAEELLGVPRRR